MRRSVFLLAAPLTSAFTFSRSCPDGELQYMTSSTQYCCPGDVFGEDSNAFCCVGATFQVAKPTSAPCFPFCSGTDEGFGISSTTSQPCSASVYLTDADYSSKVSAAASSAGVYTASGSGGNAVSTTAAPGSSGTTAGAASSSAAGSSSSGTTASAVGASSSSSHNAAAAMITSGPLAGALMVAGGLALAL